MRHDEVVAALGGVPAPVTVPGRWAVFRLPDGHRRALTTYYAPAGGLSAIAVDAVHGPQVTMEGLPLVGRVPSEVAAQLVVHLVTRGAGAVEDVRISQEGDPGVDALGLVLRAQRAGDVLISRPVFVAPEWAHRVWDAWDGKVPREEWQVR